MPLTPLKLTTKHAGEDAVTSARADCPINAAGPRLDPASPEWNRMARRARTLSWISLGWLSVEAGLSIVAAVLAGSIALLAFGIDSGIEALASIIVIWRFTGARTASATSERKAQSLVAVSFFLLALYVAIESVRTLVFGHHAETTWLGLATAVVSLMWCPALGTAKQRIGRRLGSDATAGEGRQNLLCAYMALAAIIALAANTMAGLWWIDPVAGLVIAGMAVKEGRDSWRGQTCSCCT